MNPAEIQATVGRIVHYVMPEHLSQAKGQIRPAVVVRVWPGGNCIQLQVFTDGSNDGPECATGLYWATSVLHDEATKAGGTWHWPPRG